MSNQNKATTVILLTNKSNLKFNKAIRKTARIYNFEQSNNLA